MKLLHGSPCTVMSSSSRVILHMPEGYHGVLLGNVDENFQMFKHFVKESDCIVGPMCEFEFHSYAAKPQRTFIKIKVPHIVKNPKIERNIRVISRDSSQNCIEYAKKLQPGEEPPDRLDMYFRFNESHVEIFAKHYTQYLVFAENSSLEEVILSHNCSTRTVEIIAFTNGLEETMMAVIWKSLRICAVWNIKRYLIN